jgi:hypothetical protein
MNLLFKLLFFVLLVIPLGSYAQKQPCACAGKDFVTDGQVYLLAVGNSKPASLNAIFYPTVEYKVQVCSEDKISIIGVTITDEHNNLIYCNTNKNYAAECQLKFQSLCNAKIELKLINKQTAEEPVRVCISYRTSVDKTN